jgi:hypothetical protein
LEVLFVLLEFSFPSRRIFIDSYSPHSLLFVTPLSLVRLTSPSAGAREKEAPRDEEGVAAVGDVGEWMRITAGRPTFLHVVLFSSHIAVLQMHIWLVAGVNLRSSIVLSRDGAEYLMSWSRNTPCICMYFFYNKDPCISRH